MREIRKINQKPGSNNNKNDVRVNNTFHLTINLGDSLNLFALAGGIFFIRRLIKNRRAKNKKM
ncbi:hypothetical protein M3610_19415 [Neobacillus sp. MER 74]|uniref:hypothetical protein n=1 Tax=unclassified Neobacillus TaxID=2675272 RepID=UPI00203CABFD|nr:hypothetical protein [Neobacillus sp. MER 74]MCM3117444.1 hypothetical protein [Neobacillus sp. MER 74]